MKHSIPTPAAWREALESYLSWMRAAKAPTSTMYLRSYHLRRFATETALAPFEVDNDDLVNYLGTHESWSASTHRSMRTSLRAFYVWAFIKRRMSENIGAYLPTVKTPIGVPRPAPKAAIDKAERAHDWRVRLMAQLAAYAGMRCCEIAVGHTDDLIEDLIGWSIRVHGKGRKIRIVPLRDDLAHVLSRMPRGYFFPGQIDGHLSAAHVSKMLSRALPEKVTGHMLRHSFASNAYAASGKDIRVVQELLGHASVATTQIYTAVEAVAMRLAVNF